MSEVVSVDSVERAIIEIRGVKVILWKRSGCARRSRDEETERADEAEPRPVPERLRLPAWPRGARAFEIAMCDRQRRARRAGAG
jgi:hypothetical protein